MKFLVTGATGLVGYALSKKLVSQGHDVICPIRRDTEIPGCKVIIEKFEENILSSFDEKIDVFINNIGHISNHLSYKKLKSVNVDLQKKLVEAAHKLGAKRYVQVSSTSVVGLGHKNSPITEEDKLGDGLGYGNSKRDGEKITFETCKNLGIECVAVRPTAIYGDSPKEGYTSSINGILKTPIRMIGSGEQIWHLVHVDDVSDACIAASTKVGIDGMTFNIAGPDPMKASDIVKVACSTLGLCEKGIKIPIWIASGFAGINTFFAFGKKPLASKMTIALLANSHEYDISKAEKYLGFKPKKYLKEELPKILRKCD